MTKLKPIDKGIIYPNTKDILEGARRVFTKISIKFGN